MQIRILIGLMVLVLIGATTWLILPNETTPPPLTSSQAGGESKNHGTSAKTIRPSSENTGKNALANEKKMHARMLERQRTTFDLKTKLLVAKFDLNASQTESIQEFFNGKLDQMQDLLSKGDSESMNALADIVRGEGLDLVLTDILTPEQVAPHQEQRTANRQQNVESRAKQDLASMTKSLRLSPDQRKATYQVLFQNAGARYDHKSAQNTLVNVISDGSQIDSRRQPFILPNGDSGLPSEISAREANLARIDSEIAPLATVLTSEQMTRLRDDLLNTAITSIEQNITDGNSATVGNGSTPVPPPTFIRKP
jgi:hypothetical protein